MTSKVGFLDRLIPRFHRTGWRGTTRLQSVLRRHGPYYLVNARTRHGLVLPLDVSQYIDSAVIEQGYYEEEVLQVLLQHLGDDGVLWDIGANMGLHSVTIKHLRPAVTVVAFEPSPYMTVRLALNVQAAGVDVNFFSIALGDRAGYFPISLSVEGNSGLTTFVPLSRVRYDQTMQCRCETARSFIESSGMPKPTVVKIDVEGFEQQVLTGFGGMLSDPDLRAVIFEANPSEDGTERPVFGMLRSAGFHVSPLPATLNEGVTNFVASRRKDA